MSTGKDASDAAANARERLARRWVEIREEGDETTRVFLVDGPDVPLGRGRLVLDLTSATASEHTPGPADGLRATPGAWHVSDRRLELSLPQLGGTWEIALLTDERLELRRLD